MSPETEEMLKIAGGYMLIAATIWCLFALACYWVDRYR